MTEGWQFNTAPWALAVATALAGCVPLPIPTKTQVTPRIYGRVVDAKNGKGIGGAKVECERAGFYGTATSDEAGSYSMKSIQQQHFLLFAGGPISVKYPYAWTHGKGHWHNHPTPLKVNATALGYGPKTIEYSFHSLLKLPLSRQETEYKKMTDAGLKLDIKMRPIP